MDDVEVTLLRHVAGHFDRVLGQLCMRCGLVLDEGDARSYASGVTGPPKGWEPGAAVMVSVNGGLRMTESSLRADRDRSDEADCASVL